MKRLDDEKNLAFMNDPGASRHKKELGDIVGHIKADVKADGNAQYLLTVLPPMLKRLETAYESLTVIEAQILNELEGNAG